MCGGANSIGVIYAPYGRGEAQAQSNFGGLLLFMHIPFDAELPNLTW